MTSRTRYETLVASLPHLPHFARAERLPINRERLEGRLGMMAEDDATLLARAVALLEPTASPPSADAGAWVRAWVALAAEAHEPALLALLDFHAEVRTVLAALRRRRMGLPAQPPPDWPAGHWVRHMAQHWDDPDFKLAPVFPWIGEARQHLDAGEAPALERQLIDMEWGLLQRLAEPEPFGFSAVLAYRFRWGLLQRWLSYDEARGHARFEHLIAEVRGEPHTVPA